MKQPTFSLPETDPFLTLDDEIDRLNAFFKSLRPEDWQAPTRCEGWTVRDMAAHLDSDEEYNEACLDDTLDDLLANVAGLDEFNQQQIQKRAHLSNEEVLKQWRTRQARVRKAWQNRGLAAEITTSIGPYPLRAQIWHITSEYATHADDLGVEVPPDAQPSRLRWRFQFSAFAVQEKNNPPGLEHSGDRMIATIKQHSLALSLEDFVAAVSARLVLPQNQADREIIKALRTLA